jgi:hypothetical protein
VTDVWVVNDEDTEIVRARDIAVACLDYDGNLTVRLAGGDGTVVTIAGHRAHHDEHRPDEFHRQLIRIVAELSDGRSLPGAGGARRDAWLAVGHRAGVMASVGGA